MSHSSGVPQAGQGSPPPVRSSQTSSSFAWVRLFRDSWKGLEILLAWLWKIIWWFWSAIIVGGLLISVITALVTTGAQDATDPRQWQIVKFLLAQPFQGVVVVVLVSGLTFGSYLAHRQQQKSMNTDTFPFTPAHELRPESFRLGGDKATHFPYITTPIQKEYDRAIQVLHNAGVGEAEAKCGLLILGEANAGKTRLALEVLKKALPNWPVLRWSSGYDAKQFPLAASVRKQGLILFIDDLQEYVPAEIRDAGIQALISGNRTATLQALLDLLRGTARRVLIVATCRVEEEMRVRAGLGHLFVELEMVRLPQFSADTQDSKAAAIIAAFQKHDSIDVKDWDGTLGSLVLGLSTKNSEYLKIRHETAATVLRAMKLLTLAGTTDHTERRVQAVCAGVFDEKALQTSRNMWRLVVNRLTEMQFVTEERIGRRGNLSLVIRKDIYFEKVITDYPHPKQPQQLPQDMTLLQKVYRSEKDTDGLLNLAQALHERGWDEEALAACEHAAAISPKNELAWISTGLLLIILKRYKEALAAYDRALALNSNFVPAQEGRNLALVLMQPEKGGAEAEANLKTLVYQLIDGFLSEHMKKQVGTFRELWEQLKPIPVDTLATDLPQLSRGSAGLGFAEAQDLLPVISLICWAVIHWSNNKAKTQQKEGPATIFVQKAMSHGCSEAMAYALANYLEEHLGH